ncbi:MAG: thioredoxin family protein [Mucilaginibacter sp.]
MKAIKIFCLLLLIGSVSSAQTLLPASGTVLNKAFGQAAKENKKVILIFHASWCGWCKKMDASLNDPACKKMFDDNYVIAHLDVMEQPAKANLENPGAMEVMKKYGGEKSGLPFWLVLDTKGNVLANSLMPKDGATTATPEDNVGCPASEKEISFFDTILKKTSRLKDEDIAVIHQRFLLNQPPPQPAKGTK